MTETKCFRDAFRDQLHELSGQPNETFSSTNSHHFKTNRKKTSRTLVQHHNIFQTAKFYFSPHIISIMISCHFEALKFFRNYGSILGFYIWIYSTKIIDPA